jgi:lipopolysaccharide transport system ATP-binding protein
MNMTANHLPREVAIRVENLGKQYRIGARKLRRDETLRDLLVEAATGPVRRWRGDNGHAAKRGADGDNTFWALRHVSFEIKRGQAVSIIGRNGAGKTTTLKVLSRITEPTEGEALVRGRVGTLLEVGTGFHPELSGRENIFLSGAILGMPRAEIARKLNEIIAFSEIEKFIDTPIKRYSTGMYVRLAFAVAAHLEPDILLVDEVLAVGDASFQKKCLGKMGDVAQEGRTILFVSHNMPAISRLCPTSIWLDHGGVIQIGDSRSVIASYLATSESSVGQRVWEDWRLAPGDEFIRAASVSVRDTTGQLTKAVYQDRPFVISIQYRVLKSMMNANVGFELKSEDGTLIFTSFDADNPEWSGRGRQPGVYRSDCLIPAHFLNEGAFFLTLHAGIPHQRQCMMAEDVLRFNVGASISGEGPTGRMGAPRKGLLAPDLEWDTRLERSLERDLTGTSAGF